MRYQTSIEPGVISGLPAGIKVRFDTKVFDYILYELHRHAGVEEGGKYIGHLDPSSQADGSCELTIRDFLPGGPRATRTAVEFMPDGGFQETLFRRAEQRDQTVEHLGTWHSHHCNGLRCLSGGDVHGYFRTVNKPAYRPPVFVASLVKELPSHPHDRRWIDHYLFIKGENDRYYRITDDIDIVDCPSAFADLTGHERTVAAPEVAGPVNLWYQTNVGRATLAEDQQFFRGVFGLMTKATRRAGTITICGEIGGKFIRVSYPEKANDDLTTIEVGSTRPILSIQCSIGERKLGFAAGLHALERLEG